MQDFIFERRNTGKKGERISVLLEPQSVKNKLELSILALMEAISAYVLIEKKVLSKIDDLNSPAARIKICSFYIRNAVFNYKNMIPHKSIADSLEKTIRQVGELNQQNPDIREAISFLHEAKDLSDQDFFEATQQANGGQNSPHS